MPGIVPGLGPAVHCSQLKQTPGVSNPLANVINFPSKTHPEIIKRAPLAHASHLLDDTGDTKPCTLRCSMILAAFPVFFRDIPV